MILVAWLTVLVPCTWAQRPLSAHFAPRFSPHPTGAFSRSFLYPVPFLPDPLYPDTSAYAATSPIAVIVMQAPSAVVAPAPEQAPPQPLLIELQGDRYVRLSGEEAPLAEVVDHRPAELPRPATVDTAGPQPPDLPAVLLVFIDGRSEEVSAYTISGGALYIPNNFYVNGSWNRKIDLATLNLPETVRQNRARNTRFRLPSAPNEVIVGP